MPCVKYVLDRAASIASVELDGKFAVMAFMIYDKFINVSLSLSLKHFILLKRGYSVEHVFYIDLVEIVMLQSRYNQKGFLKTNNVHRVIL